MLSFEVRILLPHLNLILTVHFGLGGARIYSQKSSQITVVVEGEIEVLPLSD